ncbi:hypothetical protein AB205_0038050 [Aquarana catesbeiana]|uniref:Uncharacterized protein n=1 Tax=Aquarana catesbeiana TaxID=8400 RepID=A0A2G9QBS7_AQUCT|nr:hypothetical protein AB205_0038050 [Aquarana catesbeiana]
MMWRTEGSRRPKFWQNSPVLVNWPMACSCLVRWIRQRMVKIQRILLSLLPVT